MRLATTIESLKRRLQALQGPEAMPSMLVLAEGATPTPEEWASIDGDPARILYYRVVDGRIRGRQDNEY